MTPQEFQAARYKLGLSLSQLAIILNVSRRTVERWEQGGASSRGVNPTAVRVVRWLLGGYRPPEWPRDHVLR